MRAQIIFAAVLMATTALPARAEAPPDAGPSTTKKDAAPAKPTREMTPEERIKAATVQLDKDCPDEKLALELEAKGRALSAQRDAAGQAHFVVTQSEKITGEYWARRADAFLESQNARLTEWTKALARKTEARPSEEPGVCPALASRDVKLCPQGRGTESDGCLLWLTIRRHGPAGCSELAPEAQPICDALAKPEERCKGATGAVAQWCTLFSKATAESCRATPFDDEARENCRRHISIRTALDETGDASVCEVAPKDSSLRAFCQAIVSEDPKKCPQRMASDTPWEEMELQAVVGATTIGFGAETHALVVALADRPADCTIDVVVTPAEGKPATLKAKTPIPPEDGAVAIIRLPVKVDAMDAKTTAQIACEAKPSP